MKLNKEKGLKLEIKQSEINDLEKSFMYLMSNDEEVKNVGVELILNILPKNKSIGVVFTNKQNVSEHILHFLEMHGDPNDNVIIERKDWIIKDDVK